LGLGFVGISTREAVVDPPGSPGTTLRI